MRNFILNTLYKLFLKNRLTKIIMTLGEMLAFPFSNSFALGRANKGKQDSYMALYSIAFSISHIFGHNSGMQLISKFDHFFTWNVMIALSGIACGLLLYLKSVSYTHLR